MKYNTDQAEQHELSTGLFQLLQAHRPAFKQERTYQRMTALFLSELINFGRHTITQQLLSLGLTDADWSAWYRLFSHGRIAEEALAACYFTETLQHVEEGQPYVTGVDATQVPRSSMSMPGTGWLKAAGTAPFHSGIWRAQRFVNGDWLTPLAAGYSRALPLRFLPAFTEKAVAAAAPACKEWAAGLRFVQWVRQRLDAAGRTSQLQMVLGDGAYDKAEFWRGLPERVVAIIRTAKNRCLRALPGAYSGRGRRRKYGEALPHPVAYLQEKEWLTTDIAVRGRHWRIAYQVHGPQLRQGCPEQPVFLLVIRGHHWLAGKREPHRKYRRPGFFLISARQQHGNWQLPLPIEQLLVWIWQRWELEVAHRELKSGLGLGEKQCWNARSAVASVQWSAWVYAVLMLAGYRAWGLCAGPPAPGRWWRGASRWSFTTLIRGYRAALWGAPEFRAIWTGTAHNWQKKEALLLALPNSVAAAARI